MSGWRKLTVGNAVPGKCEHCGQAVQPKDNAMRYIAVALVLAIPMLNRYFEGIWFFASLGLLIAAGAAFIVRFVPFVKHDG